jgi:DNA (cytosine-5)-methyltransferase 1
MPRKPIPIIDIFAGPGGLGEGFSRLKDKSGDPVFEIALSIEKEARAHETLRLRAFSRLARRETPKAWEAYRQKLGVELTPASLLEAYPTLARKAGEEAWLHELGLEGVQSVRKRIDKALHGHDSNWVLIGGPPCQAYSLVGRSRNMGKDGYTLEGDAKAKLYLEYLQILGDHAPAVFVMENVKGLLSAAIGTESMFQRILTDLQRPREALKAEGRTSQEDPEYRLYAIGEAEAGSPTLYDKSSSPRDFLVRAEKHGIPQARHRVIILGVRSDASSITPKRLKTEDAPDVRSVIEDLPPLRSGLSVNDSPERWTKIVQQIGTAGWVRDQPPKVRKLIKKATTTPTRRHADRGAEALLRRHAPGWNEVWYSPVPLEYIWHHKTRGHIQEDLSRYLFAAAWAAAKHQSPHLSDFPEELLPDHANAKAAAKGGPFSDRFRVQRGGRPSTTITSHISKDGHYYIHYDHAQVRSLTVREAARLQTFPDDYFFCGPRTSQYTQVGNAVPPLLAWKIGALIAPLFKIQPDGQPLR